MMDATNFTDGILIQTNSDGSAPTTGTLSHASGNVGIGAEVFEAITSGDYNVAIGYQSGKALTTTSNNVLMGYQTGKALSEGQRNVALGSGALRSNTTQNDNIAIGNDALGGIGVTNAADENIAIGSYAGDAVTSGEKNTLIGHSAGSGINTGGTNIALGYRAGDQITSGSGNVVIGRVDPTATGDNQLVISNAETPGTGSSVSWLLGNDLGQVNSKVNIVSVSSNTTLTNVGQGEVSQSGAIVYWTAGTLTLPYNATVGTQYVIINNTGSDATPGLNSNGDFLNGTHTAIGDKKARTYVCVATLNTSGGAPDWFGIG